MRAYQQAGHWMIDAPHTGATIQVRRVYWTGYIAATRPCSNRSCFLVASCRQSPLRSSATRPAASPATARRAHLALNRRPGGYCR
jgi:hypothetical protein